MIRKTNQDEIAPYLRDASNYSGGSAEAVVIPDSVEELARFMVDNRGPVSIAGAGTGVTAGRIPSSGAIVSMEMFNAIGDLENGKIRVGAGVRLSELNKALNGSGWFYPPNPTETLAFVGGTIATNASGSRSYKFGATREYIFELSLVLADGRRVEVKRGHSIDTPLTCSDGASIKFPPASHVSPSFKNAAGYYMQPGMDWVDLFTGSDGTLAIITGATLKLLPRPARFLSAILFFPDEEICWRSVESIKTAKNELIDPCALEYFDARCLSRLKCKYPNIPVEAGSALFLEQDVAVEKDFDSTLEAWYEFLENHDVLLDHSWFADSARDMEKFREFRHAVPLMLNEENSRLGRVKMGTDFAVEDGRLIEMMRFYRDTLNEAELDFAVFGHIGENHLHINLLPDKGQGDRARETYGKLANRILEWKGTVSAEHGIGKLKKSWFHQMVGEKALEEMLSVKRALDPDGILGAGNLF